MLGEQYMRMKSHDIERVKHVDWEKARLVKIHIKDDKPSYKIKHKYIPSDFFHCKKCKLMGILRTFREDYSCWAGSI